MGPKKRVITLRKVGQYNYSNGSILLYSERNFLSHMRRVKSTQFILPLSELGGECDKEEPGRDQA